MRSIFLFTHEGSYSHSFSVHDMDLNGLICQFCHWLWGCHVESLFFMLYFRFRRSLLNLFWTKKTKTAMSKLCKKSSCGDNKYVIASANKSNLTSGTAPSVYEVLATPLKSESDKKEYKVIRLENQLIACLIADNCNDDCSDHYSEEESESDTETDVSSGEESEEGSETDEDAPRSNSDHKEQKMAAAALCIGVGSFSDPKEVPGMAHFLEHMVFMGSEKFPSENDFDSFIKKGGGSDNASTDAETTCFYFDCLEKHLYQGLDKFAQFFISPLMKKDAMTREREAIESEFQMSLPLDSSRKEQLLCSLAQSDSPVNSFSWGNHVTLRDNVEDDKLYEGVHKFRRRHYSAHRMTLAIQARLPMETIEKYVLDCFSQVPNNSLPPDDFSRFSNGVFDTPQFTRIYYVKPMKDLYQVDLTWSLPSLRDKYKNKPHQYVSDLMGDEGRGSLLSYLRKKVWAISTSVGNGETGMEENSMYMLFTVSITLTEQGRQHLFEVIEAVFSYINLLKRLGPEQRIFDEIKSILDTSFRFASEEDSSDTVEALCESMQIYPPEDYIAGSEILYHYDPEAISLITGLLQPKRTNVLVMSRKLPDGLRFDKVEKWFGTEFTDTDIPVNWLTRWEEVEPYPDLAVPPPNPYLTKNFDILPKLPEHPEYPQKLIATPGLELWYRRDQKFELPLAYYYFHLISPLSIESASSSAMLELMLNLIVFSVSEELYPALSAYLSYTLIVYEAGLMIKIYGYNEKLPILVEVISKFLKSFADSFSADTFDALKDKLLKSYYNKVLKPSSLAKDVRLHLLVNRYWTIVDKYSAMRRITVEQIRAFSKDYFDRLYIKALVQGNVTAETATDTVNGFVNALGYSDLPAAEHPRFAIIQVPPGEKCCRVKALNKNDANSIITNYYQASAFSIKDSIIIEILMMVIEEPLFDVLRTKEQLGYNVDCSVRDTYGVLGYTVTVNAQATKHTTPFVDDRIEAFLKTVQTLLDKMSIDELADIKEDLIKTKRCADVRLKEEVERNWTEIVSYDYLFDRVHKEIAEIEKVELEEIRNWWKDHNKLKGGERFRKLTVQVVGHDNATRDVSSPTTVSCGCGGADGSGDLVIKFLGDDYAKEQKDKDYFIRDIKSFKDKLHVFPPLHPK